MQKIGILLIMCSIGIVTLLSLMLVGGVGSDGDSERDNNFGIAVDTGSNYNYNSTAEINQSYTSADFNLEVENNTYKISRVDDVPNPGTSLQVKEARVVGETLVIKEEFVDTTGDSVASASVVSTSGYEKSWKVELDIDTMAVEHPYNENPYIKEL